MDQPVSFQHAYLDQHAHPGVQPAFAVDLPAHAHFMDQPVSVFLSGPACCLVTLSTTSLLPLWTSLLTLGTSLFQSSFLDQPAHLDQPSLFRRGPACSFYVPACFSLFLWTSLLTLTSPLTMTWTTLLRLLTSLFQYHVPAQRAQAVYHTDPVMDQPVSVQPGHLDHKQPTAVVDQSAHFLDEPVSVFLSGPACSP